MHPRAFVCLDLATCYRRRMKLFALLALLLVACNPPEPVPFDATLDGFTDVPSAPSDASTDADATVSG